MSFHKRISDLESQLLSTQTDLIEKTKEVEKLKDEIKYQKKRRNSISKANDKDIKKLEKQCKEEKVKASLWLESNEKLTYEISSLKEEYQKVNLNNF